MTNDQLSQWFSGERAGIVAGVREFEYRSHFFSFLNGIFPIFPA